MEIGTENRSDLEKINYDLYTEKKPGVEEWLREAKEAENSGRIGMFLLHNGVVREDARALVREGEKDKAPVRGMLFDYDKEKADKALKDTLSLPGVYLVKLWLNKGRLKVGEDIMYVLVGGDIRPHVIEALEYLVDKIKKECVVEKELY
ncbi:MAG: molybdenum cofactor biosynthesis protein MoaE [Lachnospiraceae bacterium]|nr:molybdenum cofactor biosynthesis protein MoaE [Lachnospiraceae bacterium]